MKTAPIERLNAIAHHEAEGAIGYLAAEPITMTGLAHSFVASWFSGLECALVFAHRHPDQVADLLGRLYAETFASVRAVGIDPGPIEIRERQTGDLVDPIADDLHRTPRT